MTSRMGHLISGRRILVDEGRMALVHINRQVQAGMQRVSTELRHRASTLPKIDINKVPDWHRRATRLSIALVFFGLLGHSVKFPADQAALASNFRQSCNWAAITCIVVTAPLIGKVAQVAFDRLLGTLVGGFIGFLCFTSGFHLFGVEGAGIFISLMGGVTVWATTYLASERPLEQLVRFVQLTYIIVGFGAKPDKGAFLLSLMRVGGIFAGGLFSVLLAVVVLPRSASVESLREMKKAIKALHDLNKEVWALSGVTGGRHARRGFRKHHRHGYSALQLAREDAQQSSLDGADNTTTNHNNNHFNNNYNSTNSLNSNFSSTSSFEAPATAAAGLRRDGDVHRGAAATAGATTSAGGPAAKVSAGAAMRSVASEPRMGSRNGAGGGGGGGGGGHGSGVPRAGFSVDHLDLLVQRDEELHSREATIERLFTTVYTSLARLDENLAQTKGEIYVWHFWGRYFFLPGVHWFPMGGRWQVPRKDLEDLATCLRRVARMLWTLLLDFEEGFGAEMEAVLQLYYPKQLLSELATYQARAIMDLLVAFPGSTTIEVDNLLTLGQVTDCLMQISDARARTTVFNVKQRRKATNTGAAAAAATSAGGSVRAGGAAAAPRAASGHLARADAAAHGTAAPGAPAGAGFGAGAGAAVTRPDAEVELRRLDGSHAAPATAATPRGAANPENIPLLAQSGPFSAAVGTASAAATSGFSPAAKIDGSFSGGGGSGSGSGGGAFISRLLSGQPGNPVTMHLPPRKFLQAQQEREREQPRPPAAAAAAQLVGAGSDAAGTTVAAAAAASATPAAASSVAAAAAAAAATMPTKARSDEPIDIFAGLTFDGMAPAAARAADAVHVTATATSAATAAAQPSVSEAAAAAAAAASGPSSDSSNPSPFRPFARWSQLDQHSLGRASKDAAAAAETASGGGGGGGGAANGDSGGASGVSGGVSGGGVSGGGGAIGGGGVSGGGAAAGLDLLGGLSSRLASMVVEPVTFPPTEEGYLSQVRWYSFQFVMDEMVNELEEAFFACSAVLRQLPYPVGN